MPKLIKLKNLNLNLENVMQALQQEGCVVIENFMTREDVLAVNAELAPYFDAASKCTGDFYGYETKRLGALLRKSETLRKVANDDILYSVMSRHLMPQGEMFQINLTQAISIGPDELPQPLHRDDAMYPFQHPGQEVMINCMLAINDFTSENGATNLVPGSHKWEAERQATAYEVVQGAMTAGSCLIWLGSLLHGGAANFSSNSRTGVVLSYCLGWVRQAENQYLAVSPAQAATFPERLQRMMGYFVHAPNLGSVDGHDPIDFLRADQVTETTFKEFMPEHIKPLLAEHRRIAAGN